MCIKILIVLAKLFFKKDVPICLFALFEMTYYHVYICVCRERVRWYKNISYCVIKPLWACLTFLFYGYIIYWYFFFIEWIIRWIKQKAFTNLIKRLWWISNKIQVKLKLKFFYVKLVLPLRFSLVKIKFSFQNVHLALSAAAAWKSYCI